MADLSQRAKNDLFDALSNGNFVLSDFSIKFDGNALAGIRFLPFPDYSFIISDRYSSSQLLRLGGQSSSKSPSTLETPGDAKTSEEHFFGSIDECIRRISNWLVNIEAELTANNRASNFNQPDDEEVALVLSELAEQVSKNAESQPMTPFSAKELEKLRSQLDETIRKFEELNEENKVTKDQLERATRDLESMKTTAANYPKKVWYTTSGNRFVAMVRAVFSSKEGRAFLLEAARKYFLPGP